VTAIGSAPINAGKGVLHGVANVFKRGKDNNEIHSLVDPSAQPEPKAGAPGTQMSQPAGEHSEVPVVSSSAANGTSPEGTLKVLVLDAKDLIGGSDVKPYAVLRIGEKEHKTKHAGKTVAPEWNETLDFPVGPSTPKLHVTIFDHKTLGKDKLLGEAEVDIWQHIQSVSNSAADVAVEITNGHGIIRLRLTFSAEPTGPKSGVSSSDQSGAGTLTSPSRFSLRGRRPGLEKEE